jgi:hypothetical protein
VQPQTLDLLKAECKKNGATNAPPFRLFCFIKPFNS